MKLNLKDDQRHEVEEILDRLTNDDTALETAKEHFEIDIDNSKAFKPELKAKADSPLAVLNESTADVGILGFFNARSRRYRLRKFERRIKRNPDSFVIVSEGDSWFQYPVILKDVIDYLNENKEFAIRSFGFAADWLSNILEEAEYINALRYYQPNVFLISGGGNDIVGERLKEFLHPFNPNQPDLEQGKYLNEHFTEVVGQLKYLYHRLFTRLINEFPELHIIGHGYDYAIPGETGAIPMGTWLKAPMESRGIVNRELQRLIVKELIDRFNKMVTNLIEENEYQRRVHFLNNTGTLTEHDWYDELHPKNSAFKKIAAKFLLKINEIRYAE